MRYSLHLQYGFARYSSYAYSRWDGRYCKYRLYVQSTFTCSIFNGPFACIKFQTIIRPSAPALGASRTSNRSRRGSASITSYF